MKLDEILRNKNSLSIILDNFSSSIELLATLMNLELKTLPDSHSLLDLFLCNASESDFFDTLEYKIDTSFGANKKLVSETGNSTTFILGDLQFQQSLHQTNPGLQNSKLYLRDQLKAESFTLKYKIDFRLFSSLVPFFWYQPSTPINQFGFLVNFDSNDNKDVIELDLKKIGNNLAFDRSKYDFFDTPTNFLITLKEEYINLNGNELKGLVDVANGAINEVNSEYCALLPNIKLP